MAEEFDPYYEWLGIPQKDQPPHHYRLLGIELFEQNLNVVERAADRQMGHVRSFQTGRHSSASQRLLNELSAAKVCLLNAQRKTDYDLQLQQQLASRSHSDHSLAGGPVPELPPGVGETSAELAPFVPAGRTIELGQILDTASVAGARRRQPSSLRSKPALIGTVVAVVVLFGVLSAFYWLIFQRDVATGPLPAPNTNHPSVTGTEPANPGPSPSTETPSPANSANVPSTQMPAETTELSTHLPPPSATQSNAARIPVINESLTETADPPSLPETPSVPSVVRDTISAAAGMLDTRFAFCQTLPWKQFEETNLVLRTQGYRVSRCRPYLAQGDWRVAAIWLRDGLPSRVVGLTDAATVLQADQRLRDQGFVPVDVIGGTDGSQELFAAVWVRPKSPVGETTLTLGVPADAYKAPKEEMLGKGFRSAVHVAYSFTGGKRRYCDLWIKPPVDRSLFVWTGNQAYASRQLAKDAIHTDVSVMSNPANGGVLFIGSQWLGAKDGTRPFVGISPNALQEVAVEQVGAGYLPVSLSVASAANGELIGVSLWRPADQVLTPLELASLDQPANTAPRSPPPVPATAERALRFAGQGSVELRDTTGLANVNRDFTVETWLRFNDQAFGTVNILFGTGAYRGLHPEVAPLAMKGWLAGIKPVRTGSTAKSQFIFQWAESSGQTQNHTADIMPFDNQWHHLAFCNRASTAGWEIVVYVDGQEALRAAHADAKDAPSPVGLYFGRPQYVAASRRALHGLVRAFRLSSGVRYQSSFQPEAQFKSDSQTAALLDFSAASAVEIADLSGNRRHGGIVGADWVDLDGDPVRNTSSLADAPSAKPVVEKLKPPATIDTEIAKVREVFKGEMAAAKEPLAWAALAEKLLTQAAGEQEPAIQYALLGEARRLAVDGIDWNLAARSIDELAARFQVDEWTLRAEVFTGLTKKARVSADRKLLAEIALAQAGAALGESALEVVDSLLLSASNLAPRGERDLIKQVGDLRKRLSEEKKVQQLVRDARAKLAESPDDAPANETLGRYLCFTKGDWEMGVRQLAKGPEGKLTLLARSDEARPTDAAERVALADAWSEFAKTTTDSVSKGGATSRALHWYQLALAELSGVKKLHVEKQIEDLSKSAPPPRGKAKLAWLDGEPGVAMELRGHSGDVTSLAITRSGRFLVSGSQDDTVRMWELTTGKPSGQMTAGIGDVNALLLSPDDRTVAIPAYASGEYSIGIWSLQNGQLVGSIKADGPARHLAGSQDWRRVVYPKSQSGAGNILVYNLATLTPVAPLNCPGTPVQIAVSRSGRFLAAADDNNGIYVWDMQTGKAMLPLTGHTSIVTGLAFSPNERHLASSTYDTMIVWDLAKGLEERRISLQDGVAAIHTFSPDGGRLLVSGLTTEVSVYNVQDGKRIARVRATSPGSTTRAIVCFSDGRAVATAGQDNLIRIWRLPP